jgi:hypothetical protein
MYMTKGASSILEKIAHFFASSKQTGPLISHEDTPAQVDPNSLAENLHELDVLNQKLLDNESLQYSDVLNYVNFMNDNTTNDASSHDVLIEFESPVDRSAPTTPTATFTSDPLDPFDESKKT